MRYGAFYSNYKMIPKPQKPIKADRPRSEFYKHSDETEVAYEWAGKTFNSFLEIFKYLPKVVAYGYGGQMDDFNRSLSQVFTDSDGTQKRLTVMGKPGGSWVEWATSYEQVLGDKYQEFINKYPDIDPHPNQPGVADFQGKMGDFHYQAIGVDSGGSVLGGFKAGVVLQNINYYDSAGDFNHIRENKNSNELNPDFDYMNTDTLNSLYIYGKTWSKIDLSKLGGTSWYSGAPTLNGLRNEFNSAGNFYEIALNHSYKNWSAKQAFDLMILLNESRRRFYSAMTEIFGDPYDITGATQERNGNALRAKSDSWVNDPNRGAGVHPQNIIIFNIFFHQAQAFMNAIEAFFKEGKKSDGSYVPGYISSTNSGGNSPYEVNAILDFRSWLWTNAKGFWDYESNGNNAGSLQAKINSCNSVISNFDKLKDSNGKYQGKTKDQWISERNYYQSQLNTIKGVLDEWDDHAESNVNYNYDWTDPDGVSLPHGMGAGNTGHAPSSTSPYRAWDSWNTGDWDSITSIPPSILSGLSNSNITEYQNEWPTHNFYNAFQYTGRAMGRILLVNIVNRGHFKKYKQEMREYFDTRDDVKYQESRDKQKAMQKIAEQRQGEQKFEAKRRQFNDDLKRMQAKLVDHNIQEKEEEIRRSRRRAGERRR